MFDLLGNRMLESKSLEGKYDLREEVSEEYFCLDRKTLFCVHVAVPGDVNDKGFKHSQDT